MATLLLFPGLKAQNQRGLYGQQLGGFRTTLTASTGPVYLFGDPGVLDEKQGFFNFLDYRFTDTRFLYSVGIRHIFSNNLGIKANACYGTFAGTDEKSKYNERGYSFESTLYEFAIHGEFLLLGGPNSESSTPHTLYVYAGVGVMKSKADLKYSKDLKYSNDSTTNYSIIPPMTGHDGDSIKLKVIGPVIPFGIGYQIQFNNKISLGAEFGYQYFFSDFIDGLKTKKSTKRDVLTSLSLTIAYKINKGNVLGGKVQWW